MTSSPTFLFSSARPMGEVVEIFPVATSDSSLVTSLYSHFFVLGVVEDLDGRSEAHFVVGDVVHVDHGQVGEALAELADARLDELLALLGHVILGVLAEVAEGGGLLDLFGKFVDQLVFERVDFFLQFSLDCVCHGLRPGSGHYTPGFRLPASGFGLPIFE